MMHFCNSSKVMWSENYTVFSLMFNNSQRNIHILEMWFLTTRPMQFWRFTVFYDITHELKTRKTDFSRCMSGNCWCKIHFWLHRILGHLEASWAKWLILCLGLKLFFERSCWGYIGYRVDFEKSWFSMIFRNIDFCDTSRVRFAWFWWWQNAKNINRCQRIVNISKGFLCVFWTRHEIISRLCVPHVWGTWAWGGGP